MQVEQHRARGVARVGEVQPSPSQMPDQPAINGAEGELAALGTFACARHMVEQPGELGGREIGIELQPGACAHIVCPALGAQARALCGGATVLPHDRGRQRTAAGALPQHRGLALVGDADRRHLARGDAGIGERLARAVELGAQDVLRVVLDPIRRREVLGKLRLGQPAHAPCRIEDDGARTGRTLVEGEHVSHVASTKPQSENHSLTAIAAAAQPGKAPRASDNPQTPRYGSMRIRIVAMQQSPCPPSG